MDIIVVCALIVFILFYNKTIDGKKFLIDNEKYFQVLREEDYDFLLYAKYGDDVEPDLLFRKRITTALLFGFFFLILFLTELSLINLVFAVVIMFGVFKLPYIQLKQYYKAHLHEIDLMLPYYLKSL